MRIHLDCAFFAVDLNWAQQLLASLVPNERLRFQLIPLPDTQPEGSYWFLHQQAAVLRRFDACLLPISTRNLSWVRQALSAAQPIMQTPLVGLTQDLKAAALSDLHDLGMADYLREPLCQEDLRARIQKLRYSKVQAVQDSSASALQYAKAQGPDYSQVPSAAEQSLCDSILEQDGMTLEAYAVAIASRYAYSQESFKEAKSRVVARFEQAYLCAALNKHGGNIAMAARSAQKHRRAFWGLMRKHKIDAAFYRLPTEQ